MSRRKRKASSACFLVEFTEDGKIRIRTIGAPTGSTKEKANGKENI